MALFFLGFLSTQAAANTIKVAVVMPEGSTWTNILHQMTAQVEKQSNSEVKFKIYAGGISGDEPDVIRKMRANRIQAAGFSGIGLGLILPEFRILESVLLFENHNEIDQVKDALFEYFAGQVEKKGFVLLGFFEAGNTYIFSKIPFTTPKHFKSIKMWIWKGDKIAERFLKELSISAFPLSVADVNTGLETGLINAFYSPPLAAIALQWYTKVGYLLDYPLVNSCGAFLMNKREFDRLSAKNQKIIKDSVLKYSRRLVTQTRKENEEAKTVIKESGIKFVKPTPELAEFLKNSSKKANKANIPGLYSQQRFDEIEKLLFKIRANYSLKEIP
jgi:TRAP-type C4-dicarboxylate transport system substrate-binding protein